MAIDVDKLTDAEVAERWEKIPAALKEFGDFWYSNCRAHFEAGRFNLGGRFHDSAELIVPEHLGYAATVIASGPSLRKNVKKISHKTLNICVDSAFRYCLQNGVPIDYVLTLEHKPITAEFFKGFDTSKHKLIAMVTCAPESIEAWQGDVYWARQTPAEIASASWTEAPLENMADTLGDATDIRGFISPLGNVGSTAVVLALGMFKVRLMFLVGFDFSWTTERYCADDWPWIKAPIPAPYEIKDINGNTVYFNDTFEAFRQSLMMLMTNVDYCGGRIFNCTEGGALNKNCMDLEAAYAGCGL